MQLFKIIPDENDLEDYQRLTIYVMSVKNIIHFIGLSI